MVLTVFLNRLIEMFKKLKIAINYLLALPYIGVLSTVFIINNELVNGIVTGKYFWFYIMIGIISLTTVISYCCNQKYLKFTSADLLIFLFFILGFSVTYLNNGFFNTKLILFILLFILYFYFRIFLIQIKSNIYRLIVFFIMTGLVESIWGLRQLYGFIPSHHSVFNVTGSFFNPGPYAGYLATIFPMTLYYIFRDWNVMRRKFNKTLFPFYIRFTISLVVFISIIVILPATMSRASWIAAIGSSIFVIVLYLINKRYEIQVVIDYIKNNKKHILAIGLCTILLGVASIFGIYHMKKDSADGRTLIWNISMETIKKNPVGVGIGNFPGNYGKEQAEYFRSDKATVKDEYLAGNPEYAFNEYLQIGIELGVIPLILLIILFFNVIILGIRKKRIGAVGSLASLFIFSSMSYPFNLLPFIIILVFLIAVCVSKEDEIAFSADLKNNYIFDFRTRYRLNKTTVIIIFLFSTIITTLCLKNRFPTYKAYKDWEKAQIYYNIKAFDIAIGLYKELYPYLYDQSNYLFEYGQCLSKVSKYEESNKILQKSDGISCDPMYYNIKGKNYQGLKQYDQAERCYLYAINLVPHRLYPYYLLSKLYLEMGDVEKARNSAKLVVDKKVKIDSSAVREMKKEMNDILKK